MKRTLIWVLLTIATFCQSQQLHVDSDAQFPFPELMQQLENTFNVKYSFADSLIVNESILIGSGRYLLDEIHIEIALQTKLQVIKLSERYYAISPKETPVMLEVLDEIVVSGFLSKGIVKKNQIVSISPEKVDELPGVTDADILLSIQQLPGVKSPNETASGLHVRGGTPDQNLILWDGIRMYHPGHLFGMISAFNPNFRQKVSFHNKGVDPKFGERISSVIEIEPSDEIATELIGNAGVNSLDADVYISAPLIRQKLGIQFAARKSVTEWVQAPTFVSLAEKVFQNTNFTDFTDQQQLGFYDISAKLNYKLNGGNDFSVTGIAIDNSLAFSTDYFGDVRNQNMDIRNYGASFNWNKRYNRQFQQNVLVHYSAFSLDYQRIQGSPESFDAFEKRNRIVDSGAEINFNHVFSRSFHLDFGYQLSGNDISHSFTGRTPGLMIELDQKHLFNVAHASYFNLKYNGNTWDVHAGARYNNYIRMKVGTLEPRIFIQKNFNKKYFWQLTYESKTQAATQVRESVANDLSLENYVWILADGVQYPLQKAQQFSTGLIYKTDPLTVDIDIYYKTLSGITSMTFGLIHNLGNEPARGRGFTKGIDLLLQKNAATWRMWLTYTYQDSQNKYDGLNNGNYFPISSETRHALSLSYFKKWGNYSLSTGWFLHSGRPYSKISDNQVASFNGRRLPAYHRLNISAAYQFLNGGNCKGRLGFSIYNAYDQRTLISREYEPQYADAGDITAPRYDKRDYYSLGFTPNVFARISF